MTQEIIATHVPGYGDIQLVSYYDEFARYYRGCEPETKQWFAENIEDDWVLIDCGANIGYYTILFASLSTYGHVFSFEPTATIGMLEKNVAYHDLNNVTLLPYALGDHSGRSMDKIFRIWGTDPEERQYVFITLDDFVERYQLTRVDAIKIDVDSFDFEVLRGAVRVMGRFNPYIMVELNHALGKRGYTEKMVFKWLISNGYTHSTVYDRENYLLKKGAECGVELKSLL